MMLNGLLPHLAINLCVAAVTGSVFVLWQQQIDLASIAEKQQVTQEQHLQIFDSQERQVGLSNKLALSVSRITVITEQIEKTIEKIERRLEVLSDDVEALKRRVDRLETERKINER